MILDKNLEMGLAQVLTASAASTNYIDLGAAGDAYNELWLVVRVGTALTSSGGTATLTISVRTDTDSAFGTDTVLLQTTAIAEASCTANTVLLQTRLPQGKKRYFRVYYTVGTENFTAGTIDAMLTAEPQKSFS